jgi:hypothetical protein
LPEDDLMDVDASTRLAEAGADLLAALEEPVAQEPELPAELKTVKTFREDALKRFDAGIAALQLQVGQRGALLSDAISLVKHKVKLAAPEAPAPSKLGAMVVSFIHWDPRDNRPFPDRRGQPIVVHQETRVVAYSLHKDNPYHELQNPDLIISDCKAMVFKAVALRDKMEDVYCRLKQMHEFQLRCTDPSGESADEACAVCHELEDAHGHKPKACAICLHSVHEACCKRALGCYIKDAPRTYDTLPVADTKRSIPRSFMSDAILCKMCSSLARCLPPPEE